MRPPAPAALPALFVFALLANAAPAADLPLRHAEIVKAAEALAASSPRVVLERHGATHEGRELIHVVISSEENLAARADILARVALIAEPRTPLSAAELDTLVRSTPAVAWLGYSIHGDEFSGADAAVGLMRLLATDEGEVVRGIRRNLIVVIDPLQNPDGRERILAQATAFTGAVPGTDPESLSHQGTWPWGRTNHYFFDLNRDWFTLVHPESQGRAAVLRRYRPQVVVDAHEMGSESTFLFNPPRAPFNPNLPSTTRAWWDVFSADQVKAFDREGWSAFTREWNEELFPGYGSSIALYQGAVGILHEQSGTSGQDIGQRSGRVVTYQEAVARQLGSSLANLTTAAAHHEALLRNTRAARAEAVQRGRTGLVRAFYFAPVPDPSRADRLAASLLALGIEVETLEQAARLTAVRTAWADGAVAVDVPAGTRRVRLDQPAGLLAKTVLEAHPVMTEAVLAEEREHLEREKESRVYDATAWSPLVAAGLDAWWADRLDTLTWAKEGEVAPRPAPKSPQGQAAQGLAWSGESDLSVALAADLAKDGFVVRVGERPFTAAGRDFPRGSFILRREENDAARDGQALARAAARRVEILALDSTRSLAGPDPGGDLFTQVVAPRPGILAGSPLDANSVGFAWHLLDVRFQLRASLLDVASVASIDLQRYDVIIVPAASGGGEALAGALRTEGVSALRSWVLAGGTLIALSSGAELCTGKDANLSAARLRRDVRAAHPSPGFGLTSEAIRALELRQAIGLPASGVPTEGAGAYTESAWPAALGIPGPGSPVLGPGVWATLGRDAETARRRTLVVTEPGKKPSGAKDAAAKGGADEAPADEAAAGADDAEKGEGAAARQDERERRFLPSGALLRVDLDADHWLTAGLGVRLATLARGEEALIAESPVRVVGWYAAPPDLHLGGLLWPEAAGRLAHTAWLTREAKGRGQVILFATDPAFRGYFDGTSRALLNAVVLGPGSGTQRTIPW